MKHLIIFMVMALCTSVSTHAQSISSSNDPVEISADETLEWLQKKRQYVANGNVEVIQGDVNIKADKIIADYNEEGTNSNGPDIWQLTAIGSVFIQNTDSTAMGNKAIYNIETGLATLTGNNLKLTTPDQIITARDRMEYNSKTGQANAVGNAKIVNGTDTLSANTIAANFQKDKSGKQSLKTAKANGGVIITTQDEILTGDNGLYNAVQNTAEIKGNVKIKRGPNTLEGSRAEINLTTNVSKIFGSEKTGKRVKGVFFPGSQKDTQSNEKK